MKRPLRYQLSRFLLPALSVAVFFYFIYHFIEGEHGLLSWKRLNQELSVAEKTLKAHRQEKEALEHRVQLLQSESLDPDMLDERVRLMLNQVEDDEIVILTPESSFSSKP
jgi:cell division protein FtsB